ncbi:hypothetical protein [Desulfurivibrio alkaliphilus]|uniref:Uncharacterized protein n=1 Tax=Desulfurivibrio alkaliphilus (strain DSM 19089 / UNIQEM U267 / AHT2) TaxID=589865 RepID=D6Z294_DESAT|nr:hypothetical protein [Desulfurivibrio alkaliphilus]ADH85669.1 hypothetical protein DaAHT2_0966 [Desulfurivibrio alkaliphilus AHT 2]
MALEIGAHTPAAPPQVGQALVPRQAPAGDDDTLQSGRRVRQAESRRQEAEQDVRRSHRQKQQAVERLRQARAEEQQAARRLREAQSEHMSAVSAGQSRMSGSVINILV